jgi:tetratricopeptide (TPR) repeat protein
MQYQRARCGSNASILCMAAFLSASWCGSLAPALAQGDSNQKAELNASRLDERGEVALHNQIAALIEQLGDENFQTRRAAELALVRIGLPAFEQLRQAMNHPNVQIEVAARYLVRSQSVTWWLDTDPLSVRQVLQDYNELKNEDRETAMQKLATEKNDDAMLALCRITRYESSEKLSKCAALFLMEALVDRLKEEEAEKLTPPIREAMGDSQRPAAIWVETLVDTIDEGSPNAERWRLVAKLEYLLLEKTPRDTSRTLVMRLHRVIAALFIKHSNRQLALDIVRPCLDLVENKTMQVRNAAIWAIDAGLPELIGDLSERHSELFAAEPLLGFLQAEGYLAAGDAEKAQTSAESASDSIVKSVGNLNIVSREDIAAVQRYEIADSLRQRGMYKWAQTEYEKALQPAGQPPTPAPSGDSNRESRTIRSATEMRVRIALSELLAEGEEYAPAAQVLGDFLAKIQDNPMEKDRLEKSGSGNDAQNDLAFLMGNFNYYSGKAAYSKQQLATANSFFMQAFQHYPENPDILIAMKDTCQAGASDQFYRETLASRISEYHEAIATLEREVINSDRIMRKNKEYQLAGQCNQLAWLLSNTNERPSEAVQLSLRSLELIPDYGIYQDTLARCYFAAGQIEKAIATQELAVKNEPFQRSMLRQLEEFKAANGSPLK